MRCPNYGHRLSSLLLALACVVLSTAAWADRQAAQPFDFRFYPNRGGDFALTNQQGRAWNLATLRGKVVLLTFGYTQCPDICPATLAILSASWRELGNDRGALQALFITLDPARDTPQRLTAYLSNIDDGLIGLTGSEDEIRSVARQYHVKYQVRGGGSDRGVTIDHTAFIYLIDQQGRLRYQFPHTASPGQLADAARQLMKSTQQ